MENQHENGKKDFEFKTACDLFVRQTGKERRKIIKKPKNHLDEAIEKDDISEMKKLIEKEQIKISCLRKLRNDILKRHENTIDDYEKELKEKEADIK